MKRLSDPDLCTLPIKYEKAKTATKADDRPLYLILQGQTKEAVDACQARIREILERPAPSQPARGPPPPRAAAAAPQQSPMSAPPPPFMQPGRPHVTQERRVGLFTAKADEQKRKQAKRRKKNMYEEEKGNLVLLS